ncbi:heme ABC transporter ATP-binding protein [Commensalibacter oyaizuii]|uniref:Heme ABC transporter ATP-binding protein n=1 Tax=Commensalibacter oyaizuii TaxID=3043873 RepID=A0ABT6PZN6_9PROT|nr:heme ABC transporter ATP-binding protein [Commensalibacter sp. TBRC 16381]MDI2090315.1 heme ABC transporter ATP-binding protein [Commensalibacter sp. TBRC 16381]
MDNNLTAQNISFYRNKQAILSEVSISLSLGQFVALIGPNGAGKSSLLKLLTGYHLPTHGSCLLQGKALTAWSRDDLAKKRAVMKQLNGVSFAIPVIDVIKLGRTPWSEPLNKTTIDHVIELMQCQSLLHKNYMQLSGGEQQRVQLARVLAQLWHKDGPSGWLFLDEPTSALDLYHQQQILRTLRQLTQQYLLNVCMVVHDLNLASLWSDMIYLLNEGSIVAQGTPSDVLTKEILTRWYQADLQVIHPTDTLKPYVMLSA